jgi:hypothetical protein
MLLLLCSLVCCKYSTLLPLARTMLWIRCAMFPIVGFRYEGARGANLCQFCFWDRERKALGGTTDHEWIEHCYHARGKTKNKAKRLAEASKQGRNHISSGGASMSLVPSSAASAQSPSSPYLPPSKNDWLEIAPESSHGRPRGHRAGGAAAHGSSARSSARQGWAGGASGARGRGDAAAAAHNPPLPLGHDSDSSRRLEHMQSGIDRLAASMDPTRLANGDPTAALYGLASGFDSQQKECVEILPIAMFMANGVVVI